METSDEYRAFLMKVRDKTDAVLKGIAAIKAVREPWAKKFALRWHGGQSVQFFANGEWEYIIPSTNGSAMTATLKAVYGHATPAGITNRICDVLASLHFLQESLKEAAKHSQWPKGREGKANGIVAMGMGDMLFYAVVVGGISQAVWFGSKSHVNIEKTFEALGLPAGSGAHGDEDMSYLIGGGGVDECAAEGDDEHVMTTVIPSVIPHRFGGYPWHHRERVPRLLPENPEFWDTGESVFPH